MVSIEIGLMCQCGCQHCFPAWTILCTVSYLATTLRWGWSIYGDQDHIHLSRRSV